MKNLPDKIYLNLGEFSKEEFDEADFHDLSEVTWSEDDVQGMNEEYVRKDAFIEKACEWIKEHKEVVETEDNGIIGWIPDYFIEDFKKYMEK